jgi:hypothetical protein
MHLVDDPAIWLKELFINAGLGNNLSSILSTAGLVLIVLFLSWFSNFVIKTVILRVVTRIVKRTASTWDDISPDQKVFTRLSHFAPALVILFMAGWALKEYPGCLDAIRKMTYIYMVLTGMVVLNSFIESWHKIYQTLPISKHRTIKGYVQVIKLFVIVKVMPYMKEYFDQYENRIRNTDKTKEESDEPLPGIPFLTNLGLFRIYASSFLKNHPMIERKECVIIRHQEPEGNGLPLQVYVFSRNNSWVPFENLQSEIFEYFLASLNWFELKVFQQPTGEDLRKASGAN